MAAKDKNVAKDLRTASDLEQQLQIAYAQKCVAVLDIYSSEWGACKAISETFQRLKLEAGDDLRFFTVECNHILESLKQPDESRNHQRPKNIDQMRDTLPEVWQPILEERRGQSEPFFVLYKEGKKMSTITGVNTPSIRAQVKDLCTVKTPASEFITNVKLQDFWDEYFNPEESEINLEKLLKALAAACKATVPLNDVEKDVLLEQVGAAKGDGAKGNRVIHAEGLQKWFGEDEARSIAGAFHDTLPEYEERAAQVKLEKEAEEKRKAEEEEKRKADEEKAELERKAQADAEEADRKKENDNKIEEVEKEIAALSENAGEVPEDDDAHNNAAAALNATDKEVKFVFSAELAATNAEDAEGAANGVLEKAQQIELCQQLIETGKSDMTYISNARNAAISKAPEAEGTGNGKLATQILSYTAEEAKQILNLSEEAPSDFAADKIISKWPQLFFAAIVGLAGTPVGENTTQYWVGETAPAEDTTVLVPAGCAIYEDKADAPEGAQVLPITGLSELIPNTYNLTGKQAYTRWFAVAKVVKVEDGLSLAVESVPGKDALDAKLAELKAASDEDDKKASSVAQLRAKKAERAELVKQRGDTEEKKSSKPATPAEGEKKEGDAAAAESSENKEAPPSSKLEIWADLKKKLPGTEKGNAEQRKQRMDLFRQFDPNGNGYLSLAEVDAHCRKILKLDQLTDDLAPILMRAFTAAKDVRKAKGKNKKHGDDYVERAEFRLLIVYIYQYFELWFMFDEIDSGGDRRVNFEEFQAAGEKLEGWGVPKGDAEEQFKAIDTNGGGIILFKEFADWALKKKLDADGDGSDSDLDLPDPEKKDSKPATPAEGEKKEEAKEDAAPQKDEDEPVDEADAGKNSSKLPIWEDLKKKLPGMEKGNKEQREERLKLFRQFDPNGNGYLSLAEVDASCRKILKLDELTDDLAPILMRAFTAAKDVRKAKGKNKKHGDDYVERAEFRLLMVYIYQYFELWFMFDEIDSGDDRRVNLEEFKKAGEKLAAWGVPEGDAEEQFKAIDTNGGGIILFKEFADWALKKKLDADGDGSDSDLDLPDPEKKDSKPATPAEGEKKEEEEKPQDSSKLAIWDDLKKKLPGTEKGNAEQRKQRMDMFRQFDPNGNGYLSLAEVDAGCRKILNLEKLTDDLAPILLRAFTAAKDVRKAKGKNKKHGDDYVERAEFRMLFVYIYQYFELWFMFDEIDSGDDRRVNLEEFKKAGEKLESWGVPQGDAEAQFKAIDTNDGGIILFKEFADWALKKKLDADGDGSDSDDEKQEEEKKE